MRRLLTVMTLLVATHVTAEQREILNAVDSRELFWSELYPGTGWTLYCGEFFESRRKITAHSLYSMSWVAKALGCGTSSNCRDTSERFNRIEADMHNTYPALKNIAQTRHSSRFGIIPGEYRDFFECDFEYEPAEKIVEPRPVARGNIARALLYVHITYNLPVSDPSLEMLKKWNQNDPPSKDEFRRNDIIEKLQGNRNPFIDDPLHAVIIEQQHKLPVASTTPLKESAGVAPLTSTIPVPAPASSPAVESGTELTSHEENDLESL